MSIMVSVPDPNSIEATFGEHLTNEATEAKSCQFLMRRSDVYRTIYYVECDIYGCCYSVDMEYSWSIPKKICRHLKWSHFTKDRRYLKVKSYEVLRDDLEFFYVSVEREEKE